jgi:dTDP-4-amino-4,6-dideoxygalactose transaminase
MNRDDRDSTPVPLLDVDRGNRPIRDEILLELAKVVDSGRFLHGPQVHQFEAEMAERVGVSHAIGCASGSDALLLAMMALGIGPGDEVILPSFTFFATASAVTRLGGEPVFVDVEPGTFNVSPDAIESAITARTRAVIPVHLFGQCADMDSITEIASRHNLQVVEDAAQAIDARWRDRAAGSIGQIGCFSFYPTKNLGGMGDGGMLTTDDDETAARLRCLAAHGMNPRYYHDVIGINSRLDTLQAAVLAVKLRRLSAWTAMRCENAKLYVDLIRDRNLEQYLALPVTDSRASHVWNQFTVRVPNGRRDALRTWLSDHRIGAEVYYPLPLHQQACFAGKCKVPSPLVHSERAAAEVLSFPNFPELKSSEIERVVECCQSFFATNAAAA